MGKLPKNIPCLGLISRRYINRLLIFAGHFNDVALFAALHSIRHRSPCEIIVCRRRSLNYADISIETIFNRCIYLFCRRMHLRGNQIIQLPGLKFQHLHIHHLFITSSGVHDIDPMAFFNLDNTLRSLDLSGNLLHKIPSDAIKRLKALRTLNLSSNLITRVSTNTFFGMTSLLNLHLENNQIEDVETFAFNGPDNLTKLHLNNNRIAKLPGRMFSQLPGLEEISLSHNSLVTFPEGFLQGMGQ